MALCYRAMLVFYRREITVIRSPLLIAVYFNSRPALKREGDVQTDMERVLPRRVSTHVRKAADDMNILRAVYPVRSFNPRRRAAAKFLIFA